ncbi:MAG: hypothetical protein VKJ46_08515 [Leptolyngbyaceae bacterium]|nr:hypothetical protein [Leptolyngbyaceae bacterium]
MKIALKSVWIGLRAVAWQPTFCMGYAIANPSYVLHGLRYR